MKLIKKLSLALLLIAGCQLSANAQVVNTRKTKMLEKAYVFGFVGSFNDSIVYITNIQELQNVNTKMKSRILDNKPLYTYQLKEYFNKKGEQSQYTCVVFYAPTRSKIQKKYNKIKKQYITKGQGKYDVRLISDDDFQFKVPDVD